MNVTIEEVIDLDAVWPELEALSLGIIEYHRPWDARPLLPGWAASMRGYLEVRPGCLTLLARSDDGEAVGFITGTVSNDSGIFDEVQAFVNNLYVAPNARKKGAGSALLPHFEEWATGKGAREIRLHVNAANQPGLQFWSNTGFEVAEHVMRRPLGGKPS